MFERKIAYHCAPALAGIKSANIASFGKSNQENVYSELKRMNRELNGIGIYLELICECKKRVLVMAYRKSVLEKQLSAPESIEFLGKYGYPAKGSVDEYIRVLKQRLKQETFPHEIGVFLGYPVYDICRFIECGGRDCIVAGEWKAYHNPESARKCFTRYRACRKALACRVENGHTLTDIFCPQNRVSSCEDIGAGIS